jgi:hypothetical protein
MVAPIVAPSNTALRGLLRTKSRLCFDYQPALAPASVSMVVQGVGVAYGIHIWAHRANTHF